MIRRGRLLAGLCLLVTMATWPLAAGAVPSLQPNQPVPDLRVLIDVSGSMRRTDPDGLALGGLGLLTELLPDGSRASVWTFGSDASPLVPLDVVDDRWRASVIRLSAGINADERYTDIEAVLEAADGDWLASAETETSRSIILLTDGQVDISEDPADSLESRERVLKQRIAALQRRDVRVFPIALSDAADVELLDMIAVATGGFLSVAYSAEELLDIFLNIITGTVPGNSLPYVGKGFSIDPFVQEFTALLMLGGRQVEVLLRDPAGRGYRRLEHPDAMKWLARPGYQMITASAPVPGRWMLEAGGRPGARISIITDLLLLVDGLPANAAMGERLTLNARLELEGKPLSDPQLLELLQWRAEVSGPDGSSNEFALAAKPGSPTASGLLDGLDQPGVYSVNVIAEAGTLARQRNHLLRVYADLFVVDATQVDGGHQVRVRPRADFLVQGATTVTALIRQPDGKRRSQLAQAGGDGAGWTLDVGPAGAGEYQVELDITGQTLRGRLLKVQPPAIVLGSAAAAETELQQRAPAPAVVAQPPVDSGPAPTLEETGIPWVLLAGVATIAMFGAFGFWLYRNRWGDVVPAVEPAPQADERPDLVQDRGEAEVIERAPRPGHRRGPVGPAYEGRAKKKDDKKPGDEDGKVIIEE